MDEHQKIRISLDLETMSLASDAAIVQIGACTIPVQPLIGDAHFFSCYIDPKQSRFYGNVDRETMDWWDKQDVELRNRVFGGTTPPTDAITKLNDWIQVVSKGRPENVLVYCNGPEFDYIVLKNYWEAASNIPWQFHYRSPQSIRTVLDVLGWMGNVPIPPKPTGLHDALVDARYQASPVYALLDATSPF